MDASGGPLVHPKMSRGRAGGPSCRSADRRSCLQTRFWKRNSEFKKKKGFGGQIGCLAVRASGGMGYMRTVGSGTLSFCRPKSWGRDWSNRDGGSRYPPIRYDTSLSLQPVPITTIAAIITIDHPHGAERAHPARTTSQNACVCHQECPRAGWPGSW